jgi:hypothetical protein
VLDKAAALPDLTSDQVIRLRSLREDYAKKSEAADASARRVYDSADHEEESGSPKELIAAYLEGRNPGVLAARSVKLERRALEQATLDQVLSVLSKEQQRALGLPPKKEP